ncbi:MAG: pyridoxal phosphate-dependent aminotransferase [Chloroflexi bacterium]|nr:pyridoxal phosphate-dependent aminotransferase [Chloroflexota bacterium]
MPDSSDPAALFRLKPLRAARVSEVSETTAAAPVSPEERINFHIGNPLQDARLTSAYLRTALGIDIHQEMLTDSDPDGLMDHLAWDAADRPKLDFLIRAINRSGPYMPRGGYAAKAPHGVVKTFSAWLEGQQEGLHYETGETSGRREIILASGGIQETLRVLLFTLSSYLKAVPARVVCFQQRLPSAYRAMPNLEFSNLPDEEPAVCAALETLLTESPRMPTFLVLGDVPAEATRRRLRVLSLSHPLFFIEASNAPNHLSLAREVKLVQRVVRLLTPAIFAPRLHSLSLVFVAGNADLLAALESVHFNLKGTPSASEVELLSLLLDMQSPSSPSADRLPLPEAPTPFEGLYFEGAHESALPRVAGSVTRRLDALIGTRSAAIERSLRTLEANAERFSARIKGVRDSRLFDEFAMLDARALIDFLIGTLHEPETIRALQRSFLSAFVRHQPQYDAHACRVTSGSSRTALGILGFHCGISEVVIPDLSWSYEQCFPVVHAVPLTPALDLDTDAMIDKLKALLRQDAGWARRGAVAINNPHNATGRIFAEDSLRKLFIFCLENDITVIDDLAYQNVVAANDLPEIKTVRQIVSELIRLGHVSDSKADRVLTVHSVSKTDCMAGARLAVVEIRDRTLRARFEAVNDHIQPNVAAVLISYLFYRGGARSAQVYWQLRNALFAERTRALLMAVENLPPDRNPYRMMVIPPTGSMYPLLQVATLPAGLSLDWLSSSLARRGIGLLPLSTFARTEKGFETARTTFRLTLGGSDGADTLLAKTRRLLIDLNRLIAEEQARYNRRTPHYRIPAHATDRYDVLSKRMDAITADILAGTGDLAVWRRLLTAPQLEPKGLQAEFTHDYAPERLTVFRTRLLERALISDELMRKAASDNGQWLGDRLEREFTKDSLSRRQNRFRSRSYDRTVHPTQVYSLQAEMAFDSIISSLIAGAPVTQRQIATARRDLLHEYLGLNVTITSRLEADEILLDLAALGSAEQYAGLFTDSHLQPFLSFWSDWDGSSRPSGQGHQLLAMLVMANVQRMARILSLLRQADPTIAVSPELVDKLNRLEQRNQRFVRILNAITDLTNQLERRYRGILPYSVESSRVAQWATRFRLRRDPARVRFEHNDRYEQKMLELRQQRRDSLDDYFALNRQLRKELHSLIPAIRAQRDADPLLREVVSFQDVLQRAVITPRIQQSMITARDQFAIDTTVHNLHELNSIAGKHNNPGMTLALQISLSTDPEALIALDRKMRKQLEQAHREHPGCDLPSIWLIPLFEDLKSVQGIRDYLDRVWDYAAQSRQTTGSARGRFAEIIAEVFIAGSDLSQQVSQANSAYLFQHAKHDIQSWLVEHGSAEVVRVKMGSGEPMQRQGGYYSQVAGAKAFRDSADARARFDACLIGAARRSTSYAVTPLQGVFLGGELRTFQSNVSEQLRALPVRDLVSLLFHVREAQAVHRDDLLRAAEMSGESRLIARSRSAQELERLTVGNSDALYAGFLDELTDSFRHILYGREEDVVGLHIVSYFIGRSIPQLRDRPSSRRTLGSGAQRGQRILTNIAEIIPLSKQGSLLRAIAHNQAQTTILGVNQLTTGLFRALERFSQKSLREAERELVIVDRLLPHLPVYEILNTLRIYQEREGAFVRAVETALPAGNSALVALREDEEAMRRYLPLFQQELVRRHGVNVTHFFDNGVFVPDLLPTLRPDLAVLLQRDLFNTRLDAMVQDVSGTIADDWRSDVARLLAIPEQIHTWRTNIWSMIEKSIYQRVQSFSELGTALYAATANRSISAPPPAARGAMLSPSLAAYFRTARSDDEMRGFLISAVEYLSSFAEGNLEIPVSIIRAIHDVERIAQIEESALAPEMQAVFRHSLLQIARLAGENG